MDKIKIRNFNIVDYEKAYGLWKMTEGIGLADADAKENIKKYLDKNPGSSFVAEAEDKLIGTIMAGDDGRRGYIYHFAVAKDYRMRGVGKKLLGKALNALKNSGMTKVHIFVKRDNFSGKEIWKKLRFVIRDDLDIMSFNIEG